MFQLVKPKGEYDKVPMERLPLISIPFSKTAVDIVGFWPQLVNEYILGICDHAIWYLEAVPLRDVTNKLVGQNLLSRLGIPNEILAGQGSNFQSVLFKYVCVDLGIKVLIHRQLFWKG